jgi:hypothetical protein
MIASKHCIDKQLRTTLGTPSCHVLERQALVNVSLREMLARKVCQLAPRASITNRGTLRYFQVSCRDAIIGWVY